MRRWLAMLVLVCLTLTGQALPVQAAEPGSSFTWKVNRGYLAFGSVAYAQGGYLATGASSGLFRSKDGESWQVVPGTERSFFRQVLVKGDQVLLLGFYGLYIYHEDGRFEQFLEDVFVHRLDEAGGMLFAYTMDNWYTSSDGRTWTKRAGNGPGYVVHQNGIWTGTHSADAFLRSVDGQTWTETKHNIEPHANYLAAAEGRFVAVTMNAKGDDYRLQTSTDGVVWTPTEGPFHPFLSPRSANGRILMVARPADKAETYFYVSTDGLTWKGAPLPFDDEFRDLMYMNNEYAVLTDSGALLLSKDGVTWRRTPDGAGDRLNAVAWGNGNWVAVGDPGVLLRSTDGERWREVPSGTLETFSTVTWAGDQFVATTKSLDGGVCWDKGDCRSYVYTSKDGARWQAVSIHSPGIRQIAWGNGRYVGVDFNQKAYLSDDGRTWRRASAGAGAPLYQVRYQGGHFLALGYRERDGKLLLYRSTDGEVWEEQAFPGNGRLATELIATNDRFMLIGADVLVYYSVDGVTWAARPKVGPRILQATAGGPWYVGTVEDETLGLSYSPDGAIWFEKVELPPFVGIDALAYGDGRFVAVGSGGLILSWQISASDAAPCQTRFTDVSASLCPVVQFGIERASAGGYPDGTFRPEQGITRAEFTKLLGGTFYWKPEPSGQLSFTDTASHWGATGGFIQPAVRRGALNGFPDGTFQPDAPLTRAQLVKIALASYGLKPLDGDGGTGLPGDAWYTGWVAKARSINVYGPAAKYPLWHDGPFDPDRPATRAEALAVLYNLMSAGLK